MLYHLEHHPDRWEIWRTGGPCVAILPADQDRQEAEKLAKVMVKAANSLKGNEGTKEHARKILPQLPSDTLGAQRAVRLGPISCQQKTSHDRQKGR